MMLPAGLHVSQFYEMCICAYYMGSPIPAHSGPTGEMIAKWLLLYPTGFTSATRVFSGEGDVRCPLFCQWRLKLPHFRLPSPMQGLRIHWWKLPLPSPPQPGPAPPLSLPSSVNSPPPPAQTGLLEHHLYSQPGVVPAQAVPTLQVSYNTQSWRYAHTTGLMAHRIGPWNSSTVHLIEWETLAG